MENYKYFYYPTTKERLETTSDEAKLIIKDMAYQLDILNYKKVYIKKKSVFFGYCSILYWALQQIKTFNTVGNRIKLSTTGKRLQSLHLGIKKLPNKSYCDCVNNNKKHTNKIYNLLKDLAEECFPDFDYNQILINKNNTFKKHKDSNNIKSEILIFSVGNYKGDLHIENEEVDTCLIPIIFRGKDKFHSVPKIVGLRYSILFYKV